MTFEEIVLESEMIYEGRILNLRRDKVVSVNGGTSLREIIEHNDGVVMAAITDELKMVMVSQYRRAVGHVVFEAPAGKLEKGESLTDTCLRELREETGYTARDIEYLGGYYSSCGYCTEKIHVYLCTGLIPGETEFDDNEALDVEEYPLDELYEMVMDGKLEDAKSALAICLAYQKIKQP